MLEIVSRIESVTVFRCGAVVTRVAEIRCSDGVYPQQILIGGLPLSLEDDSLRAEVAATEAGPPPVAGDLRVQMVVPEPVSQQPDLQQPERAARRRRLQAEQSLVKSDLQRMENLKPGPRSSDKVPLVDVGVQSRRHLVEFRQTRMQAMMDRLRQIEDQLEQLRLGSVGSTTARAPLHKAVLVRLRVDYPACPQAQLRLSYRVPGARWAPAYAVRLDRDVTMAEVLMRASVYQESGEDWDDVQLSLSTSDPVGWKDLPELSSWRIGRSQSSAAKSGWRPPPTGMDLLYEDYDRAQQAPSGLSAGALASLHIPDDVIQLLPATLAQRHRAVPLGVEGNRLTVALVDPCDGRALDDLQLSSGYEIEPMAAPAEALLGLLAEYYGSPEAPRFKAAAKSPPPPPLPASGGGTIKVDLLPTERRGFSLLGAAQGLIGLMGSAGSTASHLDSLSHGQVLGGIAPQAVTAPGREHLLYGSLYMPGPSEPQRGRLQPLDLIQWALRGDSAWVARVRGVLESAQVQARRGVEKSAPAGYDYAGAMGGFDYLYPGESRVTVPSDAQFHSIPVLLRSLTARPCYVLVPRESPDVFRAADVESLPDLALPAGPADVYLGGDFLLATRLECVAPGEIFRLGLGVEQSLKVARNTRFQENTTGLMGSTQQLHHQIDIEVANRLDKEVQVQVWERLPHRHLTTEEIRVTVAQVEPPWEQCSPVDQPEMDCSYRWTLTLGSRSNATLKASYVIEIPSKMELAGGNRREQG